MKRPIEEIKFFEGPQSRWQDFKFSINTVYEMVKGFRILHFVGPRVTFLGQLDLRRIMNIINSQEK